MTWLFQPRRVARVAVLVLFGVPAILLCIFLLLRASPDRAAAEQYAVYSTYVEKRFSEDPLIVILDQTALASAAINKGKLLDIRILARSQSRIRHRMPSTETLTLLDFLFANIQHVSLSQNFVLSRDHKLASQSDAALWPSLEFARKFPGAAGYVAFSRVGFNRDLSEALFYMEHLCGLCGGGRFVLMRKVDGKWIEIQEDYTWIS